MKKTFCFLMAVVLISFTLTAACEGMNVQANDVFEYLQRTSGLLKSLDKEFLVIRNTYLINLPENKDGINQEVIQAYGEFDHVLLLEIGYCRVKPITESLYVCAGVNADGSFKDCPTPFDLLARTYDMTTFDGVSITSLEKVK